MEESSSRRIAGQVFSALQYYADICSGKAKPTGTVAFSQELIERGIQHATAQHNSLLWVDGIYASSLLQERFLGSLLRGEVPSPLAVKGTRSLQSRIVMTTPESLITTPQTILSALGLTDDTLEAALESFQRLCAQCGAHLTSYQSPSDVLAAIAQEWNGQTISLIVQSPSERFSDWIVTRGFSNERTPEGLNSALLDHLVCTAKSLTPLGASLHSLWQLPEVRLKCIGPRGEERVYSPTAWCAACKRTAERISKTELASVLKLGTRQVGSQRPEELLVVEPPHTVAQLLDTPVRELQLLPSSRFHQAQELLTALSLDMCTFGTRTDRLNARSLALVSIIATLLTIKGSHDQVIVDLPCNILSTSDTVAVTSLLEHASTTCGISILGSTPAHSLPVASHSSTASRTSLSASITFSLLRAESSVATNFTLSAGDLLQVCHQDFPSTTLFYDLISKLAGSQEHVDAPMPVTAIPLFSQLDRSARVIGQELGLIEPLTHLYAASLDARSQGLSAKDFTLFGTRAPRYACSHCRGLGVILDYHKELPRPLASPCPVCSGLRCKHPITSALFRGVPFPTVLNQPIAHSYATLAALAKARRPLEVSGAVGLHHLPLGMPLALLSSTERRKLSIASALCKGRTAKPVVIILEAPDADLCGSHRESLNKLRDAALVEGRAIWIEVV